MLEFGNARERGAKSKRGMAEVRREQERQKLIQ
jgi:hypothetical protein